MWSLKDCRRVAFVAAFCVTVIGGTLYFIVKGPVRTKGSLINATIERLRPGSGKDYLRYDVLLADGREEVALSGSTLRIGTVVCLREYVNVETKHVDLYRINNIGGCPVEHNEERTVGRNP
jgi:hypothetical protein